MIDSEKTDGQLTMMRSTTYGGSASPVHAHDVEDEIVVLLQGSGILWVGDQRWDLSEGGVAFLPRKVPHSYLFTSPTVDMLGVITPPGTQEDFMRAAGWELSRPKPDGWEIIPATLAAAGGHRAEHSRAATGRRPDDAPGIADQPEIEQMTDDLLAQVHLTTGSARHFRSTRHTRSALPWVGGWGSSSGPQSIVISEGFQQVQERQSSEKRPLGAKFRTSRWGPEGETQEECGGELDAGRW
jgi:quercetin dioxygenase-like cupin family protein